MEYIKAEVLKNSKGIKAWVFPLAFILLGFVLVFFNLENFIKFEFNWILGLMVLPIILHFDKSKTANYQLLLFVLILLGFSWGLHIRTLHISAFFLFLFFQMSLIWGRMNILPLFLLLFLSPIFTYFVEVFGFPIRLVLSEWAVDLFNLIGLKAVAKGNIISLNGNDFSVDQSCIGLNMVTTSFVLQLGIIGYFEGKCNKKLQLLWILVILSLTSIFILINNLLRINVLVLFQSDPQSLSHQLFGLTGLLLYVVLPGFFFTKWIYSRFGKAPEAGHKQGNKKSVFAKNLMLSIGILLILLVFNFRQDEVFPDEGIIKTFRLQENLEVPEGFKGEILANGVAKMENEKALVYIKPPSKFFRSDHNPMFCWKGSGYTFKKEQTKVIAGKEVFFAELEKGKDILYTVWWHENATHQTISQFDWRWRTLKGEEGFNLVNITCAKESDLEAAIGKF